jgi:HAE1 family hydrophobic/amphiphilic exporter-1
MAHRGAIVVLCAVVIISIVPLFMFVGKNFLPVDDQAQFQVSIRTAEGSTLPATQTVVERIAEELRGLPGVTDTLDTIGGGSNQAVNTASIYVKLKPIEERSLSQQDLMVRARELLNNYPKQLRVSVQPVASIRAQVNARPSGAPFKLGSLTRGGQK